MLCLFNKLSIIGSLLAGLNIVKAKENYETKGSNVTLVCPLMKQPTETLYWAYNMSTTIYSSNLIVNDMLPAELYSRLSVTSIAGKYNLQIRDIRESDEGTYNCYTSTTLKQDIQILYLILPPSGVSIENMSPPNRLVGTEGKDLTVLCVAVGGKPPPDVTLKIDGLSIATGNQSVTHTWKSISRSDDRKTVTCQASNDANVNNPKSNSSMFYLNLKPLQPMFNQYPVSTEETRPLGVSCTSTGSRPQATFQWMLGGTNVTLNSTTQATNTSDDTYTVTSTLTYSVNRTYHRQTLTCGAYNNVSTSGVVANTTVDVKFAPGITVEDGSYGQNDANRTVTCIPVGNPTNYTYYRWLHKSKYGVIIRELDGGQNGVLTLPNVLVETRYQDSGEYVCTASNGITDRDGKINQTGSGNVTVNAQPVFTSSNNSTKYGESAKNVDINVYVYSIPKYSASPKWYKLETPIPQSSMKYTLSETADMIYDRFHGTLVQIDGYRLTLTITNLVESDFNVSYKVQLAHGFGQNVEYTVLLVSASAPDTPINFTLGSLESSVLVQWEAGYNGGHEQIFYVEYRGYGSKEWMIVKIPDTKQTGKQAYTLTGLQDGTSYELRMYAENKFNKSLPTETKTIETTKDSPTSKLSGIIGGVAGGLAAVLIIIVIVWFVIFKRKQDSSTSSKSARPSSDSEVPDGLQHNILYQSANSDFKPLVPKADGGNKDKKPSTSDMEYAEVQKPNAVYAAVDKTFQQKTVQDKKQKDMKKRPKKAGKKGEKAGNNRNINQDDEYANAGMSLKDMGEGEYANPEDRNGPPTRNKNLQGLEYADLSFTKQIPQKGKKPVIHGEEDRTLYSEVDHTKKAPPPPQESAYEETNFKHG